jgi:XTP/dITP diphosphohydrolase
MPGVLSARWSGQPRSDERNNSLLLQQLADVPAERRGAHFACAVAFCAPGVDELVVEGRMDGHVVDEPRGSGGFGYDVLFEAVEFSGLTTAELDPADKDAVSHRGWALRRMAPIVARVLGGADAG